MEVVSPVILETSRQLKSDSWLLEATIKFPGFSTVSFRQPFSKQLYMQAKEQPFFFTSLNYAVKCFGY